MPWVQLHAKKFPSWYFHGSHLSTRLISMWLDLFGRDCSSSCPPCFILLTAIYFVDLLYNICIPYLQVSALPLIGKHLLRPKQVVSYRCWLLEPCITLMHQHYVQLLLPGRRSWRIWQSLFWLLISVVRQVRNFATHLQEVEYINLSEMFLISSDFNSILFLFLLRQGWREPLWVVK